jgi:hypothetical protein
MARCPEARQINVPLIDHGKTGTMTQAWYEYFSYLSSLKLPDVFEDGSD